MRKIIVNDPLQPAYTYICPVDIGKDFDERFHPHLTPPQMLEAGVFDGVYFDVHYQEYPPSRFTHAKLSVTPNPSVNFFGIHASLSLKEWQDKGRIYHEDPRGGFQWYCRYYLGRRIPIEDKRQINRRRSYKRHWGAVSKNCYLMDRDCRRKQRQSLLHRAYDSRKI